MNPYLWWTAVIALSVFITGVLVLCGRWLIDRPPRGYRGGHDSGEHTRPFHAAALPVLIDLSGRGRQERAGTGAAPVPVPAGQPHLDRHIEQAWQTAGVNARTRCWVPDMRDTATAWDRRNAAELRAILDRADTNAPWLDARFGPIMANARKAIAS